MESTEEPRAVPLTVRLETEKSWKKTAEHARVVFQTIWCHRPGSTSAFHFWNSYFYLVSKNPLNNPNTRALPFMVVSEVSRAICKSRLCSPERGCRVPCSGNPSFCSPPAHAQPERLSCLTRSCPGVRSASPPTVASAKQLFLLRERKGGLMVKALAALS